MSQVIELEDIKQLLRHYWQEYPRPKEVRDVLDDIENDLDGMSFDPDYEP